MGEQPPPENSQQSPWGQNGVGSLDLRAGEAPPRKGLSLAVNCSPQG